MILTAWSDPGIFMLFSVVMTYGEPIGRKNTVQRVIAGGVVHIFNPFILINWNRLKFFDFNPP